MFKGQNIKFMQQGQRGRHETTGGWQMTKKTEDEIETWMFPIPSPTLYPCQEEI